MSESTISANVPIAREKSVGFFSSQQNRRRIRRILQYVVAGIALVYAIYPILFVFAASIDPRNSLSQSQLIPPKANLENYIRLLNDPIQPFRLWMWNSFKISTITSILSVVITAISAFAFSRFRFRGRQGLLLTIFLLQVFPSSLTMVAVFLLLQAIGNHVPFFGLNSHAGLILVYLGGVMGINVWLMKGFFDSVPRDLDESAMIDGASPWQAFWQVIFPLVRPIMVIIGILSFIYTWGDFLLPQILLQDTEQFTVAVGLILFARAQFGNKWGLFAAGAVMGALPTIIIYLFVQDYIVSGMTAGAVKG